VTRPKYPTYEHTTGSVPPSLRVVCPHCGGHVYVEPEYPLGKPQPCFQWQDTVSCPNCRKAVAVQLQISAIKGKS
jgi:endogenous inhibitor of DNA gyrase (YacG/DUF329 family)